MVGNASAAIVYDTVNVTGTLNRIHKNLGHNPVGPATLTVTASPMFMPILPYDATYFGKDGTTVTVRDPTNAIATYYTNAAQWSVHVPAGATIRWEYTGPVTLTRLIH